MGISDHYVKTYRQEYELGLLANIKSHIGSYIAIKQRRPSAHHKHTINGRIYDEGFKNAYLSEYELESNIIKNFDRIFHNQIKFVSSQTYLKGQKKLDILAENDNSYFIIELKIDTIVADDVFQLHGYMKDFFEINPKCKKEINGILIGPEIGSGGILIKHFPNILVILYSFYNGKFRFE